MNKVLMVKCPQCQEEFNYYKSEFRPFCSERCKMVDLGHWLDGSYSIAAEDQTENAEESDSETGQD
jgi:endogenous inhibitor of DNA gyrase (YacG/DUF329 family)